MEQILSFKKGWLQLRQCDADECRSEIMHALGLNTRMAFLNRMNGKVEHKVTEAAEIERIFKKYHVNNVWGTKL